jgi:hypothetical protein
LCLMAITVQSRAEPPLIIVLQLFR